MLIRSLYLAALLIGGLAGSAPAQLDPQWKIHDQSRPKPPTVTPGHPGFQERAGQAPSDATVLFDGRDLSQWVNLEGEPAGWVVKAGAMECVKGAGYIRTERSFGDCQMHLEWAAPTPARGDGQARGNSGLFLMGQYEVQILDTFQNPTYADGYPGSVYAQHPPLANAVRPPGEWQNLDVIFRRPRFNAAGEVVEPARLTVMVNGVLVQDGVRAVGPTGWLRRSSYLPHADKLPLALQDHGNPVRFRNIWVRELAPDQGPAEYSLAPRILERCVGTYQLEENWNIQVTRTNSQLFARLGALSRDDVFPLATAGPLEYRMRTVDGRFLFQTNRSGQVEGVIFNIAGEEKKARRQP
jgi:hypothetical protein